MSTATMTAAGALVALLIPKCPACIAAYLMAFGLGSGAAWGLARSAWPAAAVAVVLSLGCLFCLWRRSGELQRAPEER